MMVLAADVRRQRLQQLRQNSEQSAEHQKLYYRAQTQSFPVFRIDLDWLIYNRHNGRLEAEMLTWERENTASPGAYDDQLHELIEGFLWKSSVRANEQTMKDLQLKQQQRAGIVSADGVIIDGNRRAMLLRRIERETKQKQYFEAIILPDAYAENEKEIVRLETQYQLGEDAKVEYGPLQKYLHVKRLKRGLGIEESEIGKLMNETEGRIMTLLGIMDLMDDYLEHIGCPGLYTMLKEQDGSTKEGMFVDLYSDLNRLKSGSTAVQWAYDPETDPLELRLIQFDYIRYGSDFSDTNKSYREISHQSSGRNFFSHKDFWDRFRSAHQKEVDPVTQKMGSLEDFMALNAGYETQVDAARARDSEWRAKVEGPMKANFHANSDKLEERFGEFEPRRLLERAKSALDRIDVDSPGFVGDAQNVALVKEINRRSFEMKKKLEKAGY